MCTIIQLPIKKMENTNGYKNLVVLFEVCDSVKSCNVYLESVQDHYENGSITENEMYTLRGLADRNVYSLQIR